MPEAIRHLRRWYWLACLWPLVGLANSEFRASLPAWTQSPLSIFSIPIAMAITAILVRVAEWRIVCRAAAADYRLCPRCLYPLAGEAGICPECGKPFTVKSAKDCWAVAER